MTEQEIQQALNSKRIFFDEGNTRRYSFRLQQLKNLKNTIKKYEPEIIKALYNDFQKPELEAFASEVGFMYEELNFIIKHLHRWIKPKKVSTPIALFPSSSQIYAEPLGIVLVIAPWNYPFQLVMAPVAGAIAAGNCVVVKPSDNTRYTAQIVEKIINEAFVPEYISVIQGPGAMIGPMLIEKFCFDHIFFTGSASVGRKIMQMASAHLTPVTLELGGKSPVIVDKDVNIDITARRLMWAKCFNAGQTCVCPDYLLAHEDIKKQLVEKLAHYAHVFLGENPLQSKDFTHIVNEKRFNSLTSYLKNVNILYGGKYNNVTRCIEPTLVDNIPEDHPLMHEEIFGPIFPVFTYCDIHEVIPFIRKNRYPLACYIFTNNKKTEKYIIDNLEFGGGCINNALVHLSNPKLPFGGVAYSGMGNYHGKYSFEVFSHKKSILKTSFIADPALRYAPYSSTKLKWFRRFFK